MSAANSANVAIAPVREMEIVSSPSASEPARGKPGPKTNVQAPGKAKRGTGEGPRFFLGRQSAEDGAVELGEEVASEGEALVRAFRSDSGTYFKVETYRAEIEMQADSPVIVKKPAAR